MRLSSATGQNQANCLLQRVEGSAEASQVEVNQVRGEAVVWGEPNLVRRAVVVQEEAEVQEVEAVAQEGAGVQEGANPVRREVVVQEEEAVAQEEAAVVQEEAALVQEANLVRRGVTLAPGVISPRRVADQHPGAELLVGPEVEALATERRRQNIEAFVL